MEESQARLQGEGWTVSDHLTILLVASPVIMRSQWGTGPLLSLVALPSLSFHESIFPAWPEMVMTYSPICLSVLIYPSDGECFVGNADHSSSRCINCKTPNNTGLNKKWTLF